MLMERRKFFKSLGLLSLAAVMPKFLFGGNKPNQIETGSFSKECLSHDDLKSSKGEILGIDMAIIPKGVPVSVWLSKLNVEKLFIYTSKDNKLKPHEMKDKVLNGQFIYVYNDYKIVDVPPYNVANNLEHTLLNGVTFFDIHTNWKITPDGWKNYMNIERHPSELC